MKKDVEARLRAIHEDSFLDSPEALLLRDDPIKFFSESNEEMCKSAEKAVNQLTKSHSIADILVREQKEAITEATEDRFAQRPYGPLFIEEIKAKKAFTAGDVVYNEDGTKRSQTRCKDCKHHHPAVWGRTVKPMSEASCKESSKFDTYNDMVFWTCPNFEQKEK